MNSTINQQSLPQMQFSSIRREVSWQKICIESYLKVTICLPWDIDLNMQTNLSHLEIPQASK